MLTSSDFAKTSPSVKTVILTDDEIIQAINVGARRRLACLKHRNKEQRFEATNGETWSTEIESCAAEMAVAKYLGVYWTGGVFNGKRAECDAGDRQVRHSFYSNAHLIIYPEDKDEDRVVLVTGEYPEYSLVGWILVKSAKQQKWFRKKPEVKSDSWWIPQSELKSLPDQL